jgi:hypothetical protein
MKLAIAMITLSGFASLAVHAQMISDPNIFNNGTTAAVVMSTTNYGGFPPSNADDLTSSQFFFGDYLRGNGTDPANVATQYLTFSGLSTPTGIGSLRFYDPNNYEIGRVATQVTIYYTTGTLAAGDFTLSDYSALNGGNPYALPTGSTGRYAEGSGSGDTFDTLTGLAIPVGTTEILLDFGPEHDMNGGPTDPTPATPGSDYNVGAGFQEIQAFGGAAVPEPGTWAMLLGGLALFALTIRRKLVRVRARA